jgi:redox-regulated HSP33 family molecular chaperone
MAEEGRLTVTCEFCKATYVFHADELDRLWA